MSYKSIISVAGIVAMFVAMFVVGVFAQRVGDVVQVQGQSYRVEEARNGRLVLQEVRGHDRGNRRDRMNRYDVVDEQLNWAEAKAEAERRGGYLAVITSAEEQREIEGLLTQGRDYWIGGYRESNEQNYKWITGERMNYTNWSNNNPSRGSQDKMQLWSSTSWRWDDDRAAVRKGYIIEWD
jgi:hypothetical protein